MMPSIEPQRELGIVSVRPRMSMAAGVIAVALAAVTAGPAAAGAVSVLVVSMSARLMRLQGALVVAVTAGAVAVTSRPLWVAYTTHASTSAAATLSSTAGVGAAVVAAVGIAVAVLIARWSRQRAELTEQMVHAMRSSQRLEVAGQQQRQRLEEELHFWATHDSLTGLANRTMLARDMIDRIRNYETFGILVLSLTRFADVNATYGPAVGDQVLIATAKRLCNGLRERDVVARIGGDEFAVLLHGLRETDAAAIGDRIVANLRTPFGFEGVSLEVKARAGLAVWDGHEEILPTEMLRRAGVAASAGSPGAPPHVFAPELVSAAMDRVRLEADLRRALDAGGEIVCYYQPLIATATGEVASVEALARWVHPERGVVPPVEFIPAAEASGLIVPLGLAVLEQACQQLRAWHASGHAALTVAVNLSARQLVEPGAVEEIARVLNRSGVDPSRVVLEITESLLVEDSTAAIETLWRLRGLGLRLAVDDFGTGYSSLSRLSEMPIDEMKIDKSFVDRIGAPVNDSAPIIRAAIAMGHALGLTVVAEGVESTEQADTLVDMECDLLQGYLLGRPEPAEATTSRLRESFAFLVDGGRVDEDPLAGMPTQRSETWVPALAPSPLTATQGRR